MTDAAAKLRQFHSTTPVWAKEDRAVLLASADTIEAQAERIRVLREALNVATNWLSENRCPLGWTVSRLRDTIEATK